MLTHLIISSIIILALIAVFILDHYGLLGKRVEVIKPIIEAASNPKTVPRIYEYNPRKNNERDIDVSDCDFSREQFAQFMEIVNKAYGDVNWKVTGVREDK